MSFDVVISGATIHDGTGRPGFDADLAVKDGKIADIGNINGAETAQTIDGRGKILCPGFVDVHSHADTVLHWENQERLLEPLLRQGITTFVGGNCGMGLAPISEEHRAGFLMYVDAYLGKDQEPYIEWETMGELMDTLDRKGVTMNCGLLAPHAIIRIAAKGLRRNQATGDQLRSMKAMLADCLDAGVLGMSTGLQYFPGLAADDDELTVLAELLAAKDAVLTSHLRSYSNTLPEAIDELISLSRRTGVRSQISHLFWVPHVNLAVDRTVSEILRWGATVYKHLKVPVPLDVAMRNKLRYIDSEVAKGVPVGVDAMPTGAGFTHAFAFFPPWALEGSKEAIVERLANRATRRKIYESIVHGRSVWPHRDPSTWSMNFFRVMGFKSIHLMSVVSDANRKYVGKHFVQIGRERGQTPFNAMCDMMLEEEGRMLVFETPTWPGDEFVERSLHASIANPNVSIASDTLLIANGKPSHLYYDCFPKLLGKYVREEKLLSLPEAIRKSTSLPAGQAGIRNRGVLERGKWADLVLFDAETVGSRSTPQEPVAFPTGIEYVFVNGQTVVSPEGYTPDPRPGQLIRRGE